MVTKVIKNLRMRALLIREVEVDFMMINIKVIKRELTVADQDLAKKLEVEVEKEKLEEMRVKEAIITETREETTTLQEIGEINHLDRISKDMNLEEEMTIRGESSPNTIKETMSLVTDIVKNLTTTEMIPEVVRVAIDLITEEIIEVTVIQALEVALQETTTVADIEAEVVIPIEEDLEAAIVEDLEAGTEVGSEAVEASEEAAVDSEMRMMMFPTSTLLMRKRPEMLLSNL
jgi:hypothetical protein